MTHFCTYCNAGYLARLLCLYESLVAQGEAFRLHVLCFDAVTARVIGKMARPELVAIPLDEVVAADAEFGVVRERRTKIEYFFTATPVLIRHCFQREPGAGEMIYLDADLYFFGPASEALAEQGEASIGIVPHRFPARLQDRVIYGKFNVGWVSFRRDACGLAAVEWWRARCLEWCHDRVEAGRFADQGYLDEFPPRFASVRGIDHPGVNAAPWNIGELKVESRAGRVWVGGRPLVFYHFQGIREVAPGWFEPGLRVYGNDLTRQLRERVYGPYLRELAKAQRWLRDNHGLRAEVKSPRLNATASWRHRWERAKARWVLPYLGQVSGRLVRAPR